MTLAYDCSILSLVVAVQPKQYQFKDKCMAGFDSDFDGIEGAETLGNKLPNIQGNFTDGCEYELKVEKLEYFESKKDDRRFTVGEFTVLSSSGEGANPPGQKIKHMIRMGLKNSKSNVKSLFSAVIGEASPKKEEIQQAIAADQPCRGQVVKARTMNTTIQSGPNKGKPFTVVSYEPVAK